MKATLDTDKFGRYLARAALDIVRSPAVQEFVEKSEMRGNLKSRFEFGLEVIGIVTCIHMLHVLLPESTNAEHQRRAIDRLYNYYFDQLDDAELIHLSDLLVDDMEVQIFTQMGSSPDSRSTISSIASIIYHSRQVEYLSLLAESLREKDILGPMGGVAMRFYEQLTGLSYDPAEDSDENPNAEYEFSPVDLALVLSGVFATLLEDVKLGVTAYS